MVYKTDDLIKILQYLTKKLGHVPTYSEWYEETRISRYVINNHFEVFINSNPVYYRSNVVLRYDFPDDTISKEAISAIRDTLKDCWENFLVLAGVGEYNYTREGLISLAKDIIADGGELLPKQELLPEQWPLSHVAIIKYFGTWESFIANVNGREVENSLEKLIAQIAEIDKKLFAFNLKLNWNIEGLK